MNISDNILEGWTIVIVDDEDDSLEIATLILEEYGANVITAINGQEGIDAIRANKPIFVISDLSMPVLDGWGLIHEVNEDPMMRDIPVIALTAHAMRGDRERALAAGFHNYLTKPLTANTFMQDLLRLLVDIPVLADRLEV